MLKTSSNHRFSGANYYKLKIKGASDANQHFYELRQRQK